VKRLSGYERNRTHDKHIHYEECLALGLNVKAIEDKVDDAGNKDAEFQDLVLTVHHCYMHAMMNTPAYKIIENHLGNGICKNLTQQPQAPSKPNQSHQGDP
jgi:hypothetical protein